MKRLEGRFLKKYFSLRDKGYTHAKAKQLAMIGLSGFNFNEKAFKKRLLNYKLLYGAIMHISFVLLAVSICYIKIPGIIIFPLVIIYLYKVLMKLRKWQENYEFKPEVVKA